MTLQEQNQELRRTISTLADSFESIKESLKDDANYASAVPIMERIISGARSVHKSTEPTEQL